MLHTRILYKHIHKLHHRHAAPFGLAAEYAHPVETLILGAGSLSGPILYCWYTQEFHILTAYVWIVLRLLQAIDAHSGYGMHQLPFPINDNLISCVTDFPWSLQHIVPFWSGADHHDFHHMAFTNNFATSFRWWDRIFGTDKKYQEYRARVRASKKAMLKASKEDRKVMEQKLMDEVEAEGNRAQAAAEVSLKTVKVQ